VLNGVGFVDLLISAEQLAERLDDANVIVVDCRFNLMDPAAGRAAWATGHIPGAFYADLDQDLAAPRAATTGRHPLPDPQHLGAILGGWGLEPNLTVVAYDDVGGAVAARLWWLLRWAGHQQVALLDGGWQAWQQADLPVEQAQPSLAEGAYPIKPGMMPTITVDEVQESLQQEQLVLLDARDAKRFAGLVEPIDTVAGHIPGSLNRPFQDNLDANKCFLPPDLLRASLLAQLDDVNQHQLACSCGSGVTACHNIFALELAGIPDAALYVGSWSEWILSPDRPVAP
jgi:thiosulfate/3-mercaptopyruvate sulfurtransferase